MSSILIRVYFQVVLSFGWFIIGEYQFDRNLDVRKFIATMVGLRIS